MVVLGVLTEIGVGVGLGTAIVAGICLVVGAGVGLSRAFGWQYPSVPQ